MTMKTLHFSQIFTTALVFLFITSANAQSRKPVRTNVPSTTIKPVQAEPAAETFDPSIFYRPMPKRMLDTPIGPDGDHEHDHDRESHRMRPIALRSGVATPRSTTIWSNTAFKKANSTVSSEAPATRAYAANNFCSAPIVDASLAPVYASAKAHMPLYIPYRHSKATVWQGFYYNKGTLHGSIDYGKTNISRGEDPGFGVYSIAAGRVTDVGWTDGGGNFVTIEHTAPNGYKYLSKYIHLRNGYTHDRNKTKAIPNKNADYIKVKKYANKNTNKLSWGKESQKVKVRKGQYVKAGQFLAYAGNTGVGGIRVALKSNGDFSNANTRSYNVHLHFSLYIKDVRPGKSGWIKVDPYGAYTKDKGNDCYDLGSNTAYNRLFAPFYPSFHNVPLSTINDYWGYYTGMGMALQTIAVTRNSQGKLMAAGSFQRKLSKSWYARFYMTGSSFQNYFNQYNKKGFRPRQINTTKDSRGKLRYSVIWEKKPAGEKYYCFFGRSSSNFSTLWDKYVKQQKYHLAEHNTFTLNGKKYHAGVFVKSSNNAFYAYHGMSSTAFNKKFKDLSSKWQITSIHVDGSKVGGVWRPKKQGYYAYYGMTSSGYQSRFNQMSSKGYRLYKVQNYANNTKFAAIWVK